MSQRFLSVRLDDEASRALSELVAGGMTQSEAMRLALVEAATRRSDTSLAAEAARLAADDADRREVADVAALMESMRAAW